MKKGGIDPTALSGLFITLLMVWALWDPITTVVDGIASNAGSTAASIVQFIPWVIIVAIIATFWEFQKSPER